MTNFIFYILICHFAIVAYYGYQRGGMQDGIHPALPRIYAKAFFLGFINLLICIVMIILEKIFIHNYYDFTILELILLIGSIPFPIVLFNYCADYIIIKTMPLYETILVVLLFLGISRLFY